MAQHSNYWTCSSFADWIRGTIKGGAKTAEGWDAWHQEAKASHPIRYWIAEEGLDQLQDFVTWPARKIDDVRHYINNRWFEKTHAMTSRLERGKWHEFDTRLLHCMFDQLVDFVETEQAWHHTLWDDHARKKYPRPWYTQGWFRVKNWRCAEAGLDYLAWASTLTYNSSYGIEPGEENYGKPTPQAQAAIETLALYNWWKHTRPARPDPMDASGWSALCDQRRADGKISSVISIFRDNSPEEAEKSRQILAECDRLEQQYEQEDEEMMIRLIRLRGNLWT